MKLQPKVSIIIPVYNGSNYLADAIDAALAQTYKNIEIIVVNDGSCDGGLTAAIAKSYAGRIRYFSKENGGVSSALNLGIKNMSGEYFSWLSHDDLYTPEKILSQIKVLNTIEDSGKVIIYSNYSIYFVDTNEKKDIYIEETPSEAFRYRVAVGNDLHGCTMIIPKSAFNECGLFDEQLRATQDYDMWFRLGKKYRFIQIPSALVVGRVHSSQVGVRMRGLVMRENIAFRKKCINELTSTEITSATQAAECLSLAEIAGVFISRGLYPAAATAMARSIKSIGRGSIISAIALPYYLTKSLLKGTSLAVYGFVRRNFN